MTTRLWKRWLNRLQCGLRTPSRRGEPLCIKRTILAVEALEERTVPSTITYATAGSASTLGNSTSTFNSLPTVTAAITASTSSNPIDLSAAAFPNGFGTGDGITGWYTADLGTTAPLTKMAEGAPAATTGALWDFNNGTTGSQALGTISTGSVNSRFGAIIQNTTGVTLTQFTLSYTGEEWWEGTSSANTQALNFDYGAFSTAPTFPTTASPSGYTADANLTFNPPKNGTQGALNGTLAGNQQTNIHDTVTGLSWANNTYLVVYWQTANTGSGDGMGIANLSFSASVAVTAPAVNSPSLAAITSSSATLGGNVASDGGSPVTERGVVYAPSTDANPHIRDGAAIKVDASGTTGMFIVPVTGLSASTSYTFEAFATNSIGTTYTAPTTFTTAAPGVITSWTFPTTAAAPDNSPAPTYGTGTAATLGMTNNYNGGNTASDDVDSTSGTANPNFIENTWRIRGAQTPAGNNGWATAAAGAAQYSQGIELDASTVGYANIVFSFDWYSTTQGIRDLQVQYNTGGGWVNYQGPSPTGTFVTAGNDYYNSLLSPVNPTIYIDLSGVAAANNNPDLGIRLVSAFDSTGTLVNSMGVPDEYASAASPPGDIIPYNNNSGNWRFGNLTFAAAITTTTAITANPPLGQSPGLPVTFTATVTPASGAQFPSGTVAFYDGATQIGATQTVMQVGSTNVGKASITLSTLTPGVHGDITAQYTPTHAGNGLIASGSSMNLVAGDPTDNPISYTINAPQATGVDVSPVVNQPFAGVVATFSDGTYTSTTGFSAQITWASGQTTSGAIAFLGTNDQTNINGQVVPVGLFSVTGTYTYTTAGTFPISVLITDPNTNTATVAPTARVAYPPLIVTDVATINAIYGAQLTNQAVATFTDPGLVANLTALGIADPTTQFSASINWGDNRPVDTGSSVSINYNSTSKVFSVLGSHIYNLGSQSYTQAKSYTISVAVTPLTVSVERIDSSDPTNQNIVGDEAADLNGLTDSPSPDFIDQFVTDPGNSSLQSSLYTFSLPTVAATPGSGNEALTNSSYSVSEGELTLSTNGEYLVTAGYNDTVSAWAPQQTFSPATVINRVIGTINGAGVINTTTDLTDAYIGDNFRGVVSTDGAQFWTAGHAGDGASDYVHYATLGATTSTLLTGPSNTPYNPENINTVEISNGQLYEGVRSAGGTGAPAGIYLIGAVGAGLPTTAGQTETLLIQTPQADPLDVGASDKPMEPFSFYMANLNDGNPTDPISGENVAYVADAEMGIARYDYTNSGWQFSYYIDSTGSFYDSDYRVDSNGNITAIANPPNNDALDSAKAGGVKGLTGRIVDGQVQLFATTAFGVGAQPAPGESLIEVTDTGAGSGFTTLATDPLSSKSELTGVAFTPTQTVSSAATVSVPTITSLPIQVDSIQANNNKTNGLGTFALSGTSTAKSFGWTTVTTALAFGGSEQVHAGSATDTADAAWSYTLFVPTAASYTIYASWAAAPSNATNATYNIYVDNLKTPYKTVMVDQTQSPETALFGSTLLQGLYAVPLTYGSHNIKVVLSDVASGNVAANGIFDPPDAGTAVAGSSLPTAGQGQALPATAAAAATASSPAFQSGQLDLPAATLAPALGVATSTAQGVDYLFLGASDLASAGRFDAQTTGTGLPAPTRSVGPPMEDTTGFDFPAVGGKAGAPTDVAALDQFFAAPAVDRETGWADQTGQAAAPGVDGSAGDVF